MENSDNMVLIFSALIIRMLPFDLPLTLKNFKFQCFASFGVLLVPYQHAAPRNSLLIGNFYFIR